MAKNYPKKETYFKFLLKRGTFKIKKRPKRHPKSGLDLLRDPGPPKRDPIGSSALQKLVWSLPLWGPLVLLGNVLNCPACFFVCLSVIL